MKSHDPSRQSTFDLVGEYGECEEQGAQQKSQSLEQPGREDIHPNSQGHLCRLGRLSQFLRLDFDMELQLGGLEKYMVIVFEGSDKKIGCQNNSKMILQ